MELGWHGAGLLTTQHSHKLLQQVQDLFDVHQVLGLQTLPKDKPIDSKWVTPTAPSLLVPQAEAFLAGVFLTGPQATNSPQKNRLAVAHSLQSQML